MRTVPAYMELTMEVYFQLNAVSKFDQAGLLVYFDEDHWLKAGIEVADDIPRLSCVVTNQYSDWSTQSWKETNLRLRVTQKGDGAYVVEAHINEDEEESKEEAGYQFIRIA